MAGTALARRQAPNAGMVAGPHGGAAAARVWLTMLRDPLAGFVRLRNDYGDAVHVPFGRNRAFVLLSRPEHVEHVLVANQSNYVKAFTYRPLRALLGDGLLTSEGPTWRRHRRLIGPVFAQRHVVAFADNMVGAANRRVNSWHDGDVIDAARSMRELALDVVGPALFGADLTDAAGEIGGALTRLQGRLVLAAFLPTIGSDRGTRAAVQLLPGVRRDRALLDGIVNELLRRRRTESGRGETPDLLGQLLAARDEDGSAFTDAEIRDEVLTLMLAGHETTATALSWTFVLLSRYPAARERLEDELDAVLSDRAVTAGDVDRLPWTRAVLQESMRLYPPAWTIEREAVADDDVAGVPVPAGASVAVPPYLVHRHPEFWPNPEGFDPARFLPAAEGGRPRYAYLPFGGGQRICVGASFAMLEATLALATIAQRHRLDLLPGARVEPRPDVTLHPDGVVQMVVRERRSAR